MADFIKKNAIGLILFNFGKGWKINRHNKLLKLETWVRVQICLRELRNFVGYLKERFAEHFDADHRLFKIEEMAA